MQPQLLPDTALDCMLTLMRSRLTSRLGRSATASTAFTQISAIGRFRRPTLQ
jgi:hypothetical protein